MENNRRFVNLQCCGAEGFDPCRRSFCSGVAHGEFEDRHVHERRFSEVREASVHEFPVREDCRSQVREDHVCQVHNAVLGDPWKRFCCQRNVAVHELKISEVMYVKMMLHYVFEREKRIWFTFEDCLEFELKIEFTHGESKIRLSHWFVICESFKCCVKNHRIEIPNPKMGEVHQRMKERSGSETKPHATKKKAGAKESLGNPATRRSRCQQTGPRI